MEFEERLKDHYKRWNIEFAEEEQFINFKNRLLQIINKWLGKYLVFNPQIDQSFREKYNLHKAEEPYTEIFTRKRYQNSGIRQAKQSIEKLSRLTPSISDLDYMVHGEKTEYVGPFDETYIYKSIKSCKNSKDLATAMQILFWLLEERYDKIYNEISKMVQDIRSISVLAPGVSFAIHQDRKQLIILMGKSF